MIRKDNNILDKIPPLNIMFIPDGETGTSKIPFSHPFVTGEIEAQRA